tara:strand:- start:193 stop:399 length:207 start_codon:yes stop_codon:yes gene_type:complete
MTRMKNKSVLIKHKYDMDSEELKAEFTELYDDLPVVMKIDYLIDAIADMKKELRKQHTICYPKTKKAP